MNAEHGTEPTAIWSLTLPELEVRLREWGQPRFRARQVFEWIYQKRVTDWEQMSNLPAALRQRLSGDFSCALPEVLRVQGSGDTTRKFLFRFAGGDMVESVLIPASPALYGSKSDRRTICLSSQVGCAYGCKFCASGLDGWKRNLSAGEIVGQFLAVEQTSGEKIQNVVFMGMGEPLANMDALLRAVDLLNSPDAIGLGARRITVSTSGLVPGIRKLAEQPRQIRLAISLHGATDEVRDRIMPVNKKYPLSELLDACEFFRSQKKQRITFEYILIRGVNDSEGDARALARLARRLEAKVNTIPYNAVEGLPWERPPQEDQERFLAILKHSGIPATLRREKGHDIDAACGQLRLRHTREQS